MHAAFDGRVYLSDSTRTPERLIRDILAWLAQATMAVITASVFTTGELLRADNHAEMLALWIACLAHPLLDWTANLLTPMLATSLHLVANSMAFEALNLVNLLLRHQQLLLGHGIVDLVAFDLDLGLATLA